MKLREGLMQMGLRLPLAVVLFACVACSAIPRPCAPETGWHANAPIWTDAEPGDAPPADMPDIATLIERLMPAVASLQSTPKIPGTVPKYQSLGSGFIIRQDGYILTAAHLVGNATEITVELADNERLIGRVVSRYPQRDVALIKVDARRELPAVPLGDSDELRLGEWVVAAGNHADQGETVATGIVSSRLRLIDAGPYSDLIQTDASINWENAGGPLFNMKGEVVGINTAKMSEWKIGFAIPINLVRALLPDAARPEDSRSKGVQPTAPTQIIPELVSTLTPAVVNISGITMHSGTRQRGRRSVGAGFVINSDGYIVTRNQNIVDVRDIAVSFQGKEYYKAKVIASDQSRDVALLRICTHRELKVVRLDDSKHMRVGERVIAVGNPFGLGHVVTSGIVSFKPGTGVGSRQLIETEASIDPANNGGPLFNLKGDVVGLNVVDVLPPGINAAIPVDVVKESLASMSHNRPE